MTPLEEIEKRLARLEERQRLLRDVVVRGFWEAMDRLDSTFSQPGT